jgi:hypothetical protein
MDGSRTYGIVVAQHTKSHYKYKLGGSTNSTLGGISLVIMKLVESDPIPVKSIADERVIFSDDSLSDLLNFYREMNNMDTTRIDLAGFNDMRADRYGIKDLRGLEKCGSLFFVELSHNDISDISPLSGLSGMAYLYLDYNEISDLSPLTSGKLGALRHLSLNNNKVGDISAINSLIDLEYLSLSHNKITDITALSALYELFGLDLSHNRISDISVLGSSTLTLYNSIDLSFNDISDISALSGLNIVDDIIDLSNNQITDIKALVDNPNFRKKTKISLTNNPLSDRSLNEYIPQLKNKGILVEY